PLTIDPGTIDDASVVDGANIEYQWEVSRDAGANWTPIQNATNRVLTWTPSNDFSATFSSQAVQVRLCLGDDGFGNDVANCENYATNGTNDVWKNIIIHPNILNTAGLFMNDPA